MKNTLSTLIAFSAIGLSLAALPAFAGESEPLHVNVPFAFTAGKTALPAGEYTVYENNAHLLMIRGAKTSVLILGAPGVEAQDEKNALGFERTAKGIQLRSVHAAGRPSAVIPAVVNEK